ncbi:MAG: N-formylglutamate amidohydrolase [Sandarakinorhabdus sp.]|nr:N-formylglutamate amidohydrolase [Sandarakinorhabdus sp.]
MNPFHLVGALDGRVPLLLASPHSGTCMPREFLAGARLSVPALRRIEDAHVGRLLAPSAALGIPLLEATHSRALIDLNRAEDELDPEMFDGPVAPRPRMTERVRRGYGLFPRLAGPDQPIHTGRLSAALAAARIEALHRPWHDHIAKGLAASRHRSGYAVLLDVHSMPSLEGRAPAQLVLGDLNGTSASARLVDWLEQRFSDAGFRTARNIPYAGGYTTERHGRPACGVHAVQLEFDRALYMDMDSLQPHAGFGRLAGSIAGVMGALLQKLPRLGLEAELPLAAE